MSDVRVLELNALIEEIKKKEDELEAQGKITTELNKQLAQLEGKAVNYLKELGQDEYISPIGKVGIEQKWRVNLPSSDEEKMALFEHLRERGIFEKYATVNSASLNALFMRDWEVARKQGEGMTFSMPGIQAPKLFEKFKFKEKKNAANQTDY